MMGIVRRAWDVYGDPYLFMSSRSIERILRWIWAFHIKCNTPCDNLALHFINSDLRHLIFNIEGILRIYVPKYSELERSLLEITYCNHILGRCMAIREIHRAACEASCSQGVIQHLSTQNHAAIETLDTFIRKNLAPDSRGRVRSIRRLVTNLGGLSLNGYEEDRTYIKYRLQSLFGALALSYYDMRDFEKGIHEFRRDLKWLLIYLQSLDGLVKLDETLPELWNGALILDDEWASTELAVFPDSTQEENPIRFSRSLYLANALICHQLGNVKRSLEIVFALTSAYITAEQIDRARALSRVEKRLDLRIDELFAEAQVIFRRCEQWQLFRLLGHAFE